VRRDLVCALALVVVSLSAIASAQTASTDPDESAKGKAFSYGYVFAGPGGGWGDGSTLHIGGGGEGVFSNGLGLGAEIGMLMPAVSLGDGLGVFSLNGSCHFSQASKSGNATPFITGGYTAFFRGGYANGVNFGAGVNYWIKTSVGLRVEVRDALPVGGEGQFFNVRVGVTFR
jgi:hypothetical protein